MFERFSHHMAFDTLVLQMAPKIADANIHEILLIGEVY